MGRMRDAIRVILAPTYGLDTPASAPSIMQDNLYANPIKNVGMKVPDMNTFLVVVNPVARSMYQVASGYSVEPNPAGIASLPTPGGN